MRRDNKNKELAFAVCALLGALSARADVAWETEGGVGQSDNISRDRNDEIDETLASLGLDLEWRESSRRIEGEALVDLSYVEYLEDTYDSEVIGNATGDVTFGIIPERFTWQVTDNFGQAESDPFSPVTPDSRENINYFTTGPDFILRFGQAMSVQLSGRFVNTDYEDSPLDADRTSYGLALARQMSARSRLAFNVVADETSFDEALNTDFERRNAFLSYDLGGTGRTTISARAGYSWLELDGRDSTGGLLLDLDVTRALTASSSLVLTASHQFSDSGEMLADTTGGGGGGFSEITASSDPFKNTAGTVEWHFDRNRTSIGVSAGYAERRYETQTVIDSDRTSFSVDLGRQMQPTLRAALVGSFISEDFINTGLDSDDWTAGFTLDWRFGRNLGLRLRAERFGRSSSNGLGEYTENRAFLSVTFGSTRRPGSSQ